MGAFVDKVLVGHKIRLRPKRLSDAINDYAWRTDPELSGLDAAQPLALSFEEYLKQYATELHLFGANGFSLAIETMDGKHIGNCACFAVNEANREAELGIIIGDRAYWNRGYGADAVTTLINHIFSDTHLERIYLKTLDWNLRAQKCFQKCGFIPCGRLIKGGHKFVLMELRRSNLSQKPKLKN